MTVTHKLVIVSANTQPQIRILIVEDEFVTLDNLRDSLERCGYTVSGDAMSVQEAVQVLDRRETDLAIVDINLRGVQAGLELGNIIRRDYRLPFLYLSAYSDQATVAAAAATKPSGYLVKPFQLLDLQNAIRLALHQAPAQEASPEPEADAGKI